MAKIDRFRLEKKLVAICSRGYRYDKSEDELLDILGYIGTLNYDQVEALLIKFVRDFIGFNINADIMLMALRLLRGYRRCPEIGDRRRLYVQDSNYLKVEHSDLYAELKAAKVADEKTKMDKTIYKATERLRKNETALIEELAAAISRIEDIPAYINEVSDYIKEVKLPDSRKPVHRVTYPIPSYLSATDIGETLPPFVEADGYILTPYAHRWETTCVLGRDEYVAELCEALENNTPHIQITGMGGIGKTEILNKVYIHFAHSTEHCFDHIALLSYDGSMDAALIGQLDIQGGSSTEKTWKYLRDLCDKSSVLLLVDDIRPQRQGEMSAPDASFDKLFSLRLTVLLASRTLINGFEERAVDFLPTDGCMQIFSVQRYRYTGKSLEDMLALSKEDSAILQDVIENRAGNNTLIVNRLGAMAHDYGWSVSELAKRLEDKQFDIRKGFDDEEKLQEEISKLYSLDGVQTEEEKNILEAFALFPVIPLEQKYCIEWLHEDAELDEDNCRLILNALSSRTWLTSHMGEDADTVSYSMHQLVRTALVAQTDIKLKSHLSLVTHCSRAINRDGERRYLPDPSSQLVSFANSLAEYFYNENNIEIVALINWVTRYNGYEFGVDSAWCQRALSICEELSETKHQVAASLYTYIAVTLMSQKKDPKDREEIYFQALEWYQKALVIRKNLAGISRLDAAYIYAGMGTTYYLQEEHDKALQSQRNAIRILESVLEMRASYSIDLYNLIVKDMALIYRWVFIICYEGKGDCDGAAEALQQVLPLYQHVCGDDDDDYTNPVRIQLAHLYYLQEKYNEALKLCEKASEFYEGTRYTSGSIPVHPHPAAEVPFMMAAAHLRLGETGKALEIYQKVKNIYENYKNGVWRVIDFCSFVDMVSNRELNIFSNELNTFSNSFSIWTFLSE